MSTAMLFQVIIMACREVELGKVIVTVPLIGPLFGIFIYISVFPLSDLLFLL